MNLEHLTPAPWNVDDMGKTWEVCQTTQDHRIIIAELRLRFEDDAEFIALARNALDVMLRRRWSVQAYGNNWYAAASSDTNDDVDSWPVIPWKSPTPVTFSDPFTALVVADRWYKDHVEGKDGGA